MALTPMMRQYLDIKEKYKDAVLFFRLGDFYEMFFDDAVLCSKELELTLTGKDCGLEERAPMCGVPFHSSEVYVHKLIQKGYKVAICEQVEDPKEAKGLVKRDVVRVVTPGTILNTNILEEKKNNYLMSIYEEEQNIGLSFIDISTGSYFVTQIQGKADRTQSILIDEMAKFMPSEVILNQLKNESLIKLIKTRFSSAVYSYHSWAFEFELSKEKLLNQFQIHSLDSYGLGAYTLGVCAAGALLQYVQETQKVALQHVTEIKPYSLQDYMILDISSRRNLELTETLREKNKKGSLLWVLDQTETAMGGRMLRQWIEQPLLTSTDINKRLDAVEEIKEDLLLQDELKASLDQIYDLERLVGKIVYGTVNARDLIALKKSLNEIPLLRQHLQTCSSEYLQEIYNGLDELTDCTELIENAIIEEPPLSIKEGNIIKTGYHEEVDCLQGASKNGKQWIVDLEQREKEATGIKNLKIGFNKIFGYYFEVTKSYYDLVPEYYTRKQTLANAERFITPELKEMESTVLGAEEKLIDLEYKLFVEIRELIAKQIVRIQNTAKFVSILDVLQSFAKVAHSQNYVKPVVNDQDTIKIIEGRHPVVEKMLASEGFVTNDTFLNQTDDRFMIITGPNMAGKSTYMRQVALIVLMAQIGCFVPASEAEIGVVDRIFTRVGASDDLASGQSTFMVEMSEVSNILLNASSKSLLILDEIGRGTSTFDGLSIAWAVIEYINDISKIGAKTLFATHYHELTELEGTIQGVKNYSISVKEHGDDIIFLRKIIRGGADHSYGIQVAKLAGLPQQVILRAKEILHQLEENDIVKHPTEMIKESASSQINLFDFAAPNQQDEKEKKEIIHMLKELNLLTMTPMEAMNSLYQLHLKAQKLL